MKFLHPKTKFVFGHRTSHPIPSRHTSIRMSMQITPIVGSDDQQVARAPQQPAPQIVVIHDTPQFVVREFPLCNVCKQPMSEYKVGHCGHLMHDACMNGTCGLCEPTIENKVFAWMLWLLMGTTGVSHLLTRQYYLAVLHALCPGFFFLFRVWCVFGSDVVLGGTYLFGSKTDEVIFILACNAAYRPEMSILAMWVIGEYYTPLPDFIPQRWQGITEFVFSVGSMFLMVVALHINEQLGVTLLALCLGRYVWKLPSIWDIHPGNCFGFFSIAFLIFGSILAAGVINQTFHTNIALQVFLLSRVFFYQRSMKNYFTMQRAQIVVYSSWHIIYMIQMHQVVDRK